MGHARQNCAANIGVDRGGLRDFVCQGLGKPERRHCAGKSRKAENLIYTVRSAYVRRCCDGWQLLLWFLGAVLLCSLMEDNRLIYRYEVIRGQLQEELNSINALPLHVSE